MNERTPDHPPPPRGAGAGGGGRSDTPPPNATGQPLSAAHKLGPGWAPDPDARARQKDRTRVKRRAQALRKELTPSEKQMWLLLRGIEGARFRKEVAIGDYVFDFVCYAARLLIEIDGSIHRLPDVQANDKAKEIFAITQGFRVLRFQNNDVWDRPAWVVEQVRTRLGAPHPPAPAPRGGGGEESSTQ